MDMNLLIFLLHQCGRPIQWSMSSERNKKKVKMNMHCPHSRCTGYIAITISCNDITMACVKKWRYIFRSSKAINRRRAEPVRFHANFTFDSVHFTVMRQVAVWFVVRSHSKSHCCGWQAGWRAGWLGNATTMHGQDLACLFTNDGGV